MVNRCVFYRINREKEECGVSLYTLHSSFSTLHSTFYTLPIYLIIILLAKFRIGSHFNRNKVPSY